MGSRKSAGGAPGGRNHGAGKFADVGKIYQMGEVEVAAVHLDMSFTIEQGEFVVIVGPSGGWRDGAEHARRHGLKPTLRRHHADGARANSFNRKQLTQYRRR